LLIFLQRQEKEQLKKLIYTNPLHNGHNGAHKTGGGLNGNHPDLNEDSEFEDLDEEEEEEYEEEDQSSYEEDESQSEGSEE
jgi:hypothetical protein